MGKTLADIKPYKIRIQRLFKSEPYTKKGFSEAGMIGELEVVRAEGGTLGSKLYTMENDTIGEEANADLAIPAGVYTLRWHTSSRPTSIKLKGGKYKALHICRENDEGFNARYILIHIGNYPQDTLGCVLVGKGYVSNMIKESKRGIKELYDIVEARGPESFELIINDIKGV